MHIRYLRKHSLLLCAFLLSVLVYAQEESRPPNKVTSPLKTAGVPAGFQFLLEKQTTAIDVFYGDVYITTTLASYTPSTLEFQNPQEVVAGLKNLITPEQVARDLTGEIDSHPGEVCYRSSESDCGSISPDTVGVIFDEGRFRADIFINPNLLSVQQVDFNRYLPASSSGLSSVNNLSLIYSGQDTGDTSLAFGGQSLVSLRESRVITNWVYLDVDKSSGFNLETLYWQMDQADYQYQAGWFDSDARFLSFMPTIDLLGFRYSTSFKARTDLSFAAGTPLQIYLASRSRVNIFKEGKFLSTAFYDPGNQTLDTSMLPDGAYDIELRIVDSSGREERVTRYYVKTQRLPPVDQDLYFIEAGDIQTSQIENPYPKSKGIPLIQGGYGHRLTDRLGLNTGLAATDSDALSEIGLFYMRDMFDIEPKVLLGGNGAYGWSFGGYGRYSEWNTFFQTRRVWNDENLLAVLPNELPLSPPSLKQYSLGISHPVWEGSCQLMYSASERMGEEPTDVISLYFGRGFVYGSQQLLFSSEISKSDNDKLVKFSVNWNFSQGRSNHTLTTSAVHEDNQFSRGGDMARVAYGGSWFDEDLRPEDINVRWDAQADRNNMTMGVSNEIHNAYGTSEVGVNMLDGEYGQSYQYSAYLSTVVGGEGSNWGVGGKSGTQGALVVEVEADVDSTTGYDLFVNNVNYGRIYSGQKNVIPVMPYQTYTVRLSDKDTEFVSFDEKTKLATIYPGNVKAMKWKARSVGVLIGRVVRKVPGCFDDKDSKCWYPLAIARAKNVNDFSATDSDGYIQAEVFRSDKSFILIKKGNECVVDFSHLEFIAGVAHSEEDLRCIEKPSGL